MSGLPCGPVVKTLPSNAGGKSLILAWETRSHMPWGQNKKKNQDIKQKDYCNKFNKDFKNGKKKNPGRGNYIAAMDMTLS